MSCQWHPTIISPADGWVAAASDTWPAEECWPEGTETLPTWGGLSPAPDAARGLFSFHSRGTPARLHHNRPAREAALGRSLPAGGGHLEDRIRYWNEWPVRLEVRNQSAVDVTVDLRRTCDRDEIFVVPIAPDEHVAIGPMYGAKSTALAFVYGSLTVPTGVDVRVSEVQPADPGLSWDPSCVTPDVTLLP